MKRMPRFADTSAAARSKLFDPILAGANPRERAIACLGALLGIALTGLICGLVLGQHSSLPLIVAPLGASAVLLFAVPASPLAQPWPIIGGNTISALIGVLVGHFVHDQTLAIGLSVSGAIAAMSLTRSLHPPGGAAALTAIVGGPAVTSSGFLFPFVPVCLNSVLLVALGYLFHKAFLRNYPHRAGKPLNPHHTRDSVPALRAGFQTQDIEKALETLKETYDIGTDDLDTLLRQVEFQALIRSHGAIHCEDIMSRDIVTVGIQESAKTAVSRLISHSVRTLPVLDENGHLLGTVGLRELLDPSADILSQMSPAIVSRRKTPALSLLPTLTDGRSHAVVIVDENNRVEGIITQADLLSATAKLLFLKGNDDLADNRTEKSPPDNHAARSA